MNFNYSIPERTLAYPGGLSARSKSPAKVSDLPSEGFSSQARRAAEEGTLKDKLDTLRAIHQRALTRDSRPTDVNDDYLVHSSLKVRSQHYALVTPSDHSGSTAWLVASKDPSPPLAAPVLKPWTVLLWPEKAAAASATPDSAPSSAAVSVGRAANR